MARPPSSLKPRPDPLRAVLRKMEHRAPHTAVHDPVGMEAVDIAEAEVVRASAVVAVAMAVEAAEVVRASEAVEAVEVRASVAVAVAVVVPAPVGDRVAVIAMFRAERCVAFASTTLMT